VGAVRPPALPSLSHQLPPLTREHSTMHGHVLPDRPPGRLLPPPAAPYTRTNAQTHACARTHTQTHACARTHTQTHMHTHTHCRLRVLCSGVVETVGRLQLGGKGEPAYPGPFTAHPKLDPATGGAKIKVRAKPFCVQPKQGPCTWCVVGVSDPATGGEG